jgi:hypothetical protein
VASFDAAKAVEPMHCILRPFADWEGDIPEPTSAQLQEFMNAKSVEAERSRKRLEDLGEEATAEQVAEVLNGDEARAGHRRQAEIYSAVCTGKPPADDLEKLPFREFNAFANWLTGELLNPEAVTGAGNVQG